MREGQAPLVRREDYAPPAFWIRSVELTFDLDPAKTIVGSKLTIERNPAQPAQPLRLHGEALLLLRVLADGDTVLPRHLQLASGSANVAGSGPPRNFRTGLTVWEMERDLIMGTLSHVNENRTHAAQLLGISIRTLRNKLKEYRESGAAAAALRNASQENLKRSDGTEIAVT